MSRSRTHRLLEAPVLPALAFPLVMLLQMTSAGAARLSVVLAAGLALAAAEAPLGAPYAVIALGMTVYGALIGWSVFKADWSR